MLALQVANAAIANQFRFSSPQAVAELHQRIESTARSYCGRQFSRTRELREYRDCVEYLISELTIGVDAGRRFTTTSEADNKDS